MEADRMTSAETIQTIYNKHSDVCEETGCFKDMFSSQLKDDVNSLLKRAQKTAISPYTGSTGHGKIVGCCNSFYKPPNQSGIECPCLYPTQLNQAVIIPVHKEPTINEILPKLTNLCYMTLKDSTSGYHNHKPYKKFLLKHICISIWQVYSPDYH